MKGSVMGGDRLEASYIDHCSFGSGSSALSWWASCMWALLSLSSPPVGVVTTYEQGAPFSFFLISAGFHFSVTGS